MASARRSGVVGLALTLAAGPAAAVEGGCFAAGDAMAAERWAEAVTLLEARVEAPACAENAGNLRYSLGFSLEQLAADDPSRACDAAEVYRAVRADDAAVAEAAKAGAERAEALCARSRRTVTVSDPPKDEPSVVEARVEPAPEPGALRWVLAGSAVGLAAAGGVLLFLGVQADDERAAAEAVWLDPGVSDAEAQAARGDFDEAGGRATALGISGWAALAASVGLGVAAVAVWSADGPAVAVGPGGMSLGWRF